MRVLIVDDDKNIRSSLAGLLSDESIAFDLCGSGEEAAELLQRKVYSAALLDVMMPGMNGIELLKHIRQNDAAIKVLMMSGEADYSSAVQATRLGALDFFEKPLNPDKVILALKNIEYQTAMEKRLRALESFVDEKDRIVGESRVMQHALKTIAKCAPSESRVFIFGENGTGKELAARMVHRLSLRKNGPFVSLNCAALPKDLVESELFGYEKGAFTGAQKRKPGRFEQADGGTLFLDEIGDMSLETQAKLLRVLQENEAVRLGGTSSYTFNVRVISATNKDLKLEIEKQTFREDLFYRLNVMPVTIPPLRDRKDDIPLLAAHFLKELSGSMGSASKSWSAEALEALQAHDWPGNVRELRNTVERLIIMAPENVIEKEDVEGMMPVSACAAGSVNIYGKENRSFRERIEAYEKSLLEKEYAAAGGNISRMAKTLQMDRANLHRKLKSYGYK